MYWFSPIPLNKKLRDKLIDLNINKIDNLNDTKELTLLIYNPPELVLEYIYNESEIDKFNLSDLIEYYKSFNKINLNSNLKLIAGWSIENLDSEAIINLFNPQSTKKGLNIVYPKVSNLVNLIALELIKNEDIILDLYKDIELKSDLLERDIDLNIKIRLKQSTSKSEFLLNDFSEKISHERNLYYERNNLLNINNSIKDKLKEINLDLTKVTNEKNNILEKNNALKAYSFKLEEDLDSFYEKNLDLENLSNKQDAIIQRASSVIKSISQSNIKKLIKVNEVVHDININLKKSKQPLLKKIRGILRSS